VSLSIVVVAQKLLTFELSVNINLRMRVGSFFLVIIVSSGFFIFNFRLENRFDD